MEYVEETYVELMDGRRGLIVEVRPNEQTQYDIEMADGELVTVFHDEILQQVILPTK